MFLFANVFVYLQQNMVNAFFDPNSINFIISPLSKNSKMQFCTCLGRLGFYPEFFLLPGFHSCFTQLPRVKLSRGFTHQPWTAIGPSTDVLDCRTIHDYQTIGLLIVVNYRTAMDSGLSEHVCECRRFAQGRQM